MNDERIVYLMLRGHNSYPDDAWIGIFEDIDMLRRVYMESFTELKKEQRKGRYREHDIQLYRFKLNAHMNGEVERVSPSFLWE